MTPVVRKVEQLIALACSTTHEEEARTAALAAVRLIRAHELKISTVTPAPTATTFAAGYPDWFVDIMREESRRHYGDAWDRTAGFKRRPTNPPPNTNRPPPPPNVGRWLLTTRTEWCDGCGDRIPASSVAYKVADKWWCQNH